MSAPIALAGVWALSGLAAVFLIIHHGLRTLRSIRADQNLQEVEWAETVTANVLEQQDLTWVEYAEGMCEQREIEHEFVEQIEAWLKARTIYEQGEQV